MQSKKNAFTLIELLVVISIILIASSIIFIGGGGGDGAALSSSQRIVSGIAQGARGQAILKNAETRLIIYADTTTTPELDKVLRYFGIVYWGTDSDGNTGWMAATQGTYLPEGIYFDPDLSDANNWTKQTMSLNYPLVSAQTGGTQDYYYYAFNSNGTLENTDNPWLVIRSGTLTPNPAATSYSVEFPGAEEEGNQLRAALILRRSGTTTMVDDPADITN